MKLLRYIDIAPKHCWIDVMRHRVMRADAPVYLFRNRPGVKPGRWGIGFFGLVEFGSRNPGDPVGLWLKERGLWPW